MAYLVVNTPPVELFVKKEYLYDLQRGHGELVEGIWVIAKSIQGRSIILRNLHTRIYRIV